MRWLTLVVCLATLESHAQFEWGVGAGAFTHVLSGSSEGSPVAPSVSNAAGARPLLALFYRERSKHMANFFAELSLLRSTFSTEIRSGGHYGSTKYLDVRLDDLYLTLGPEFGSDNAGLRIGMQIGFLVNGRQEGSMQSESSLSGLSWQTIPPSKADDFTGDLRFLASFHYKLPLKSRLGLCIDPFLSLPLSSILKGQDPKLVSQQMGFRLGVFRKSEKGGAWKALRGAAPNRDAH